MIELVQHVSFEVFQCLHYSHSCLQHHVANFYLSNRNSLQFTEGSDEGRKLAVVWSAKAPVHCLYRWPKGQQTVKQRPYYPAISQGTFTGFVCTLSLPRQEQNLQLL